jgi:hypothetical protein
MSYNLKWDLYGPPIFSIGRIDINSNRPPLGTYTGAYAQGGPWFYRPEMMNISLKDCVTINASVLENLRSYMNIPFPLFYLVEENLKSAIKVGDAPVSTMRLTNFTITNGVRGGNTFSLELITGTPLEYIVCPELKIDHMEIKVGVVEKIPSRQIVVCRK